MGSTKCNVPSYIFGDHTNCSLSFCRASTKSLSLGACARVMVVIVCVCVCVCEYDCYRTTYYVPRLQVSSASLHGSLWYLRGMHQADFTENALFSSSAVIHFQLLPIMLPDEFSMDKMNISELFSRYEVCSFSDSLD